METNPASTSSSTPDYRGWSKDALIARIQALEAGRPMPSPETTRRPRQPTESTASTSFTASGNGALDARADTPTPPAKKKMKESKQFDFSAHPRRRIALRFAYLGWPYNGLVVQNGPTPLPTVEGVLWDALCLSKLVDETKGMDGAGFDRCGRTDKGVSSAGQVVSLWVRSQKGTKRKRPIKGKGKQNTAEATGQRDVEAEADGEEAGQEPEEEVIEEELPYVHILNRILPPSIRVLGWSPVSPTFSARFNCRYRHYKYFFDRHLHPSLPLSRRGGLDIELMRDAASRLVGEHDFRNFCKVDPTKQIDNFKRRILSVSIDPVPGTSGASPLCDGLFVLNLRGKAFLWHQVRHIMAVLFLVGARLETPDIVDKLLNVGPQAGDDGNPCPASALREDIGRLDQKPNYLMADALPLVLYECGFDEEDVQWRVSSYDGPLDGPNDGPAALDLVAKEKEGRDRFLHALQTSATEESIRATIASHFISAGLTNHSTSAFPASPVGYAEETLVRTGTSALAGDETRPLPNPGYLSLGGGLVRHSGRYIPILELPRGDPVQEQNERYREGRGKKRIEKWREAQASREKGRSSSPSDPRTLVAVAGDSPIPDEGARRLMNR